MFKAEAPRFTGQAPLLISGSEKCAVQKQVKGIVTTS